MIYAVISISIILFIYAITVNERQESIIYALEETIHTQINEKHSQAQALVKKNQEKRQKVDELECEVDRLIKLHGEQFAEYSHLQKKYREDCIELVDLRQDRQIMEEVLQNTRKELEVAKDRLRKGAKWLLKGEF